MFHHVASRYFALPILHCGRSQWQPRACDGVNELVYSDAYIKFSWRHASHSIPKTKCYDRINLWLSTAVERTQNWRVKVYITATRW